MQERLRSTPNRAVTSGHSDEGRLLACRVPDGIREASRRSVVDPVTTEVAAQLLE